MSAHLIRFAPLRATVLGPLLCGLLSCGVGTGAWAQAEPKPSDLTALRYYYGQGDKKATDAELQRLHETYPDWTPPADLSTLGATAAATGPEGAEVDPIYQLIAVGKTDEAQSRVDALRAKFPNWTPPADMMDLLTTAQAQARFDATVNSDPSGAAALARQTPALTRCDRVNNVWQLADSQARNGQKAAALGAYQSIVGTCPKYADVYASVQKADPVASPDELSALVETATRRFPDQAADLAKLRSDLLAGRGGRARSAASAPATGTPPTSPRQSAPSQSVPRPSTDGNVSVGGAVAVPASQWDGLPLTGDGRIGAMRAASHAGDWGRCIALTPEPRSLELLNERGWCSLNLDRPMEALGSFSAAAKARGRPAMVRDARYGMAMVYLKMNMSNDAAKLAAATNFTASQRRDVEGQILTQRATGAYDDRDYRRAIGYLNALDKVQNGLPRGLAMLRAYAYMNGGDARTAYRLFQEIDGGMSDSASRHGLSAAGDLLSK